MSTLTSTLIAGASRHVIDMSWHSPVQTWTTFNMITTHSITDSLNTSSITDQGTGLFTLFWTTPYDNGFYMTGVGVRDTDDVLGVWVVVAKDSQIKNSGDWASTVNTSAASDVDSPEVNASHSGDMTIGLIP